MINPWLKMSKQSSEFEKGQIVMYSFSFKSIVFFLVLETLIHAVRIYSQDIGMGFGIEKCAMLVMKSGKRLMTDGMELPNHDKIRTLEENEPYKYLGILEADTIKQMEMKDKIRKEYTRRIRKLLETKLPSRNLIKGIDTWAVPLVRYSGPFLKWTRDKWIKEQEN